MDKVIDEDRARTNKESCVAGKEYRRPKYVAPGTIVDADASSGDDGAAQTGGKTKVKDDKGKGKGQDAYTEKGKGKGKGKTYSQGRPLRCVHFWFGLCKSHPLKPGETCKFGPHVANPRDDEKERPQFKKMEAIHGPWEKGKFKYPSTAAAAKKPDEEDPGSEVGAETTPTGSPRHER